MRPVPGHDPQPIGLDRDRDITVKISADDASSRRRQQLKHPGRRITLTVAAADRHDRDFRPRRLEKPGVLLVTAVPRNDKHVRVQLNALCREFGLVMRVEVAGRQHPKTRHRELHDPAGLEFGDHLPAQRADEMQLARRIGDERDVHRRRPPIDANGRVGREACADVDRADRSRVQRAGYPGNGGRRSPGEDDPLQLVNAQREQAPVEGDRCRAGIDQHRGLRSGAHHDRGALTDIAGRHGPIRLRPVRRGRSADDRVTAHRHSGRNTACAKPDADRWPSSAPESGAAVPEDTGHSHRSSHQAEQLACAGRATRPADGGARQPRERARDQDEPRTWHATGAGNPLRGVHRHWCNGRRDDAENGRRRDGRFSKEVRRDRGQADLTRDRRDERRTRDGCGSRHRKRIGEPARKAPGHAGAKARR